MNIAPTGSTTFLLAHAALAVLLPLIAWSILFGRHDARATAMWCSGGMLSGASLALLAVRPGFPGMGGALATGGLAMASYLLRTAALHRERGRRFPWRAGIAIGVLATLAYTAAEGMTSGVQEGVGVAVRAAGATWLGTAAWRLHREEGSRSTLLIAGACALLTAAFAWRGALIVGQFPDLAVPTAADYAAVNVSSLLLTLFAHAGYVGLAWERARIRERQRTAEFEREHARLLQAEQHARELDAARAERLNAIEAAVPAMMHSIDARGLLLAVSDTWLDKLGYERSEVIGRASTDFLTPASRDYARQTVLPEFFRAGRCDNVAYQMLRKDGGVIEVLLSAVLERGVQGQPLRSLAMIEDVSDLRARQAELEREQAHRRKAEQYAQELDMLLNERNEMLRVLAHEVRQPLNNASAALQGARAAFVKAGAQAMDGPVQQAQGVLTEVLAGLDNTLAVAALLAAGQARPDDSDVDNLLGVVIADMPPAARVRIRIERTSPTRTAAMDPALMRLALRNLVSNALTYSPPASPVAIQVLDEDSPLALVFDVHSAGPRIAEALVPRLFERGTRGQNLPDRPGSGLGLHIVRRVMQLHGGDASLACNSDDRVSFRLVVPQNLED